ncbi:MAG: Dihydropteroate synthase, partial [uncultured Nocardioides sp.]
ARRDHPRGPRRPPGRPRLGVGRPCRAGRGRRPAGRRLHRGRPRHPDGGDQPLPRLVLPRERGDLAGGRRPDGPDPGRPGGGDHRPGGGVEPRRDGSGGPGRAGGGPGPGGRGPLRRGRRLRRDVRAAGRPRLPRGRCPGPQHDGPRARGRDALARCRARRGRRDVLRSRRQRPGDLGAPARRGPGAGAAGPLRTPARARPGAGRAGGGGRRGHGLRLRQPRRPGRACAAPDAGAGAELPAASPRGPRVHDPAVDVRPVRRRVPQGRGVLRRVRRPRWCPPPAGARGAAPARRAARARDPVRPL